MQTRCAATPLELIQYRSFDAGQAQVLSLLLRKRQGYIATSLMVTLFATIVVIAFLCSEQIAKSLSSRSPTTMLLPSEARYDATSGVSSPVEYDVIVNIRESLFPGTSAELSLAQRQFLL